jgi:hypothetical protein
MMTALKNADPVREHVVPYDEGLLSAILAQDRRAPTRRRRRKAVVAAWLSAVLIPVAGVGVAGAAGVIPAGARNAFPWVGHPAPGHPGQQPLDLSTAVRVMVEPGPDSRRFEVWVAHGTHGYLCVAKTFVAVDSTMTPRVALPAFQGAACSAPSTTAGGFAENGGADWGSVNYTSFAYTAGLAVRAELHLADGAVRAVPVQNGWVGGWLPKDVSGADAVLIGYAASGAEVGRTVLFPS